MANVGAAALQPLYKRGLVYFDVKIRPSDHVAIPPLEAGTHLDHNGWPGPKPAA